MINFMEKTKIDIFLNERLQIKVFAAAINQHMPEALKIVYETFAIIQTNSEKAGIEPKDFPSFVKWLKENEAGSIQEFAQRCKKENEI